MKRILTVLFLAVLFVSALTGCHMTAACPKHSLAQIDRFEEGETGELWCVASIDEPPYSISILAGNDFDALKPGDWAVLFWAEDGNVYAVESWSYSD